MNIHKHDRVLEVGSGNNPRPQATILTDRLLFDNSERAGTFSIVIDRPMIIADGFNLPFKDKAFDYVICSHVLEHLDDPERFVQELQRVAKRGYIEVPSSYGERLFGWDFHHWYCEFRNNTLVMNKKTEGERFGGFFHRLIATNISFRRFCELYEETFYVKYEWKDSINIKVSQQQRTPAYLSRLDSKLWEILQEWEKNTMDDVLFFLSWMGKRIIRKIKKEARIFFWRLKKQFQREKILRSLLPYLRCPTCHKGELLFSGQYKCVSCGQHFSINGIFPVLLTKEEIAKGI